MKIIHLNNLKRECVLVELPEEDMDRKPYGFDQTHIYHGHAPIVYHLKEGDQNDATRAFNLDKGYGWKLIGHFPSLKEQDFEGLVKEGSYMKTFWNYVTNDTHKSNQLKTARESFLSYLESEGWYTENPYGEETEYNEEDDDLVGAVLSVRRREAQEKVIYLSNSYIFIKEEA